MDLFKEIFKFFIDKEYSFASKFVGFISVLIILLCLNNLFGFSFYYSNNQKISQLKDIETLKKACSDNKELLDILNESEKDLINRQNVFDAFMSIFSKEPLDSKKGDLKTMIDTVYLLKHDTIVVYEKFEFLPWRYPFNFNKDSTKFVDSIKKQHKSLVRIDSIKKLGKGSTIINRQQNNNHKVVNNYRSKIWHTLSSSYLLILVILSLFIVPFAGKKFNWSTMIGILFFIIIIAGIIWINQYLLGLIPVVLNRPWINYVINFLIQTSMFIIIGLIANSRSKNKNAT